MLGQDEIFRDQTEKLMSSQSPEICCLMCFYILMFYNLQNSINVPPQNAGNAISETLDFKILQESNSLKTCLACGAPRSKLKFIFAKTKIFIFLQARCSTVYFNHMQALAASLELVFAMSSEAPLEGPDFA